MPFGAVKPASAHRCSEVKATSTQSDVFDSASFNAISSFITKPVCADAGSSESLSPEACALSAAFGCISAALTVSRNDVGFSLGAGIKPMSLP